MSDFTIGGIDCRTLASTCGTPLYIYDEAKIEAQLADYMTCFQSSAFETEIVYASKAFSCKAIFEKVAAAGASLDVVSGGELYLAHQAGFPMNRVFFHGNNKTEEELKLAFELGCQTIVLDNLPECLKVVSYSKRLQQDIDVMLRVNPGIEAHTHEYIMTAHTDSKFGISADKRNEIAKIVHTAESCETVHFKGFHSHIGSQITETEAFCREIELLTEFIKGMKESYGITTDFLSLGGGFGIRYLSKDKQLHVCELCETLARKCEESFKQAEIAVKKVLIEPGRSIVGEAGFALYTVGYQKETAHKSYLFVDGGMSDNIRPALYQAEYECDLANKMDALKIKKYCIAGKNCESGDILIKEATLPVAEEGDLLIMYSTGAYGYAMASNYNRMGRPAVVFVKDKAARLVLKRESWEDQMRSEANERIIGK